MTPEYTMNDNVKRQLMSESNITAINTIINELVTKNNFALALEYINEQLKTLDDIHSNDNDLINKLIFTKTKISQLIGNNYDVLMTDAYIKQLYSNKNNTELRNIIYNLIQYISPKLKDNWKKTLNLKPIFSNIPTCIIDNDFINFIMSLNPLLTNYIENIPVLTQEQYYEIMISEFDYLNDNKSTGSYQECHIMDVIFKDHVYDNVTEKTFIRFLLNIPYDLKFQYTYIPENISKKQWMTPLCLAHLIQCHQKFDRIPQYCFDKDIIKLAFRYDYKQMCFEYKFLESKFRDDPEIIQYVLYLSREILGEYEFIQDVLNYAFEKYPDTIKYMKNVDYDMCYKAYTIHGDTCVDSMPDNLRKIFI